jgi:hypothetical protein
VAAGDLTTTTAVRDYLRLEDSIDDAWIASLVTSSSAWFKTATGRDFLPAEYIHILDGDGGTEILLPQVPVASVSGVTVDGVAIPARPSVTAAGWVLDGDVVALSGYAFTEGVQNVSITYRGGYEAVPPEVTEAVTAHAALRYRDRDWSGITGRSLNGETLDRRGEASSGAWAYIRGVVEMYRRVSL